MIKLIDLPKDFYLEYYQQLPQIDERDVRMLWHCGGYNGSQDGLLLYQGDAHWFQIFRALSADKMQSRENKDGSTQHDHFIRYLLIELSDQQAAEETYWHKQFQEKVGTSPNYSQDGCRTIDAVKAKNTWPEFYKAYKTRRPRDWSNNQVIGWFEYLWVSLW